MALVSVCMCDVRSVEVHCDYVVAAGGREHVSDQPCALERLVLATSPQADV